MAEPTDQEVVDRLARLDAGSTAPDLTAAEVRWLGDRRRRRTVAAVGVGAAVAVVAAVTPLVLLTAADGDAGSVEPAGPSRSGGAPQVTTEIPDDFPIDTGLTRRSRADQDGPFRALRGFATPDLCGADAWPVAGVEALSYGEGGEGEYFRGRVLVTYADPQTASAVVDGVRSALAGCPESVDAVGNDYINELIPPTTDLDSVTWSTVLATGQPGGTVYQFLRVGGAVLATADSAEWTTMSARDGATRLTYDNLGVVDAMCAFSPRGC